MFKELIDFLFPPLCVVCKCETLSAKHRLCLNCQHSLESSYQKTKFYKIRAPYGSFIESAKAIYIFEKGSPIQVLLHRLKYNHRLDMISLVLQPFIDWDALLPDSYDVVIPVPLHYMKKRKRGYNQSDQFAKVLSQKLQASFRRDILKRVKYTKSQAKMTRGQRVWGLEGVFEAKTMGLLNKRVLIVDDVLTTGSTVRACAQTIHDKNPYAKIDVLAVAAVKDV